MPDIIVPLPEEDLVFLRAYSETQGTSVEALLARQAHNLRELLQKPLSPEVVAATGVISPDMNGEAVYREYLEKKYS